VEDLEGGICVVNGTPLVDGSRSQRPGTWPIGGRT